MSRNLMSAALAAIALAAAPGLARAQDTEEKDVQVHKGDNKKKKVRSAEKVAYLGVSTEPVRGIVATQLGLPKGQGLTVINVAEKSPATGILQNHDILLRFEDQILINRNQLGVLVRSKKPGAKVKLEILRKAERQTVELALGEREAGFDVELDLDKRLGDLRLKVPEFEFGKKGFPFDEEAFKGWLKGLEGDTQKEVERWLGKGQNDKSVLRRQDDEHVIELTVENGKTRVRVLDKNGKVILEQEVAGEDSLKDVAPELRAKIFELKKRAKNRSFPRGRFLFPEKEDEESREFFGRQLPRIFERSFDRKLFDDLSSSLKELQDLLGERKLEELEKRLRDLGERFEKEGKERGNRMRRSVERGLERARRNPWTKKGGSHDTVIQQRDDEHSISITVKDGDRRVEVKDANGKLVYEGPYNTEDQRQAVPEAVRGKVEKLMKRVVIERKEKRHHR